MFSKFISFIFTDDSRAVVTKEKDTGLAFFLLLNVSLSGTNHDGVFLESKAFDTPKWVNMVKLHQLLISKPMSDKENKRPFNQH